MRFQLLRRLLHPQPQLISSPSSYVSQQNPSSLTDLSQRQISWPWASWQQWHFKPSNTNPSHCIPTTTTTCNAKHFFFFLARRWRCTLQMSTGFLRSSSQQWSAILQQINLLGFRSKLWLYRKLTPDGAVFSLVGANVAVFILWHNADPSVMNNHFVISWDNLTSGRLHTLITGAFSHYAPSHIINNMMGLYFFGGISTLISGSVLLANIFGPIFLLKLYLGGAFSGSIFYLAHRAFVDYSQGDRACGSSRAEALGASAAVNAIIWLNVFLFPKRVVYNDLFIPLPAALLGAIMIGTDIWRIYKADGKISGVGHLGGALVGVVVYTRIRRWM